MNIESINWYPGHMKKTKELILANLRLVDLVLEVCDARIPKSSRNPIFDELISNKPRIIILGKKDLADDSITKSWLENFGNNSLAMNNESGDGIKKLLGILAQRSDKINANRGLKKPLRLMIIGIPNSGKSSLINRLTGKKSAQTGNRPGITRGKQWLSLQNNIQLLDTPGILWPKLDPPEMALNLAFCGAIRDEIMDLPDLCLMLIKELEAHYKTQLFARYKLDNADISTDISPSHLAIYEAIGKKRGLLKKGGDIDYERTARVVIDEFRAAKIGKISLEFPSERAEND